MPASEPPPIEALVLDVDGVLVESEALARADVVLPSAAHLWPSVVGRPVPRRREAAA